MDTEISVTAFAHNLRYLRRKNRRTQKEIANLLSLDRSTYAYYETGRTHPKWKIIIQIAWLYQVRIHYLFSAHSLPLDDTSGVLSLENFCHAPELNLPFHLRAWRLYRNMHQWQIAEHLGMDRSTYAYYESGKSEPSLATIVKLVQFYDFTIDQLLGFIPEL